MCIRDRTKRTHAEWAEKNGFRWFSETKLPEEDWISNEICGQVPSGYGKIADSENNYESVIDSRQILTRVSDYVRDRCVLEAASQGATSNGSVWSSESLHYPAKFSVGGDADPGLTASNTVHLDGFLYDEVDEQAMIDSGSLSRAYCKGILQY